MNVKDAMKAVEAAGTSINRERLQEAIRKATTKEFAFARDPSGNFALVKVPM